MSVDLTRHGHVAVVVMNRPEVRNAMSREMAASLGALFDKLTVDDDVRAVIITGAGDRAFCAGQDLREVARVAGDAAPVKHPAGGWGGIARREFPKPLIAAVNGFALGGGFEIVLSCDLVVAEKHAMFGLPEVRRGVAASAGGLVRIARRLPASLALELALTGTPITAAHALELGLVNRLVDPGLGLSTALELAQAVCTGSPVAVRLAKRVVLAAIRQGEDELFALQDRALAELKASPDFAEGIRAFVEKRPPSWQVQSGPAADQPLAKENPNA